MYNYEYIFTVEILTIILLFTRFGCLKEFHCSTYKNVGYLFWPIIVRWYLPDTSALS